VGAGGAEDVGFDGGRDQVALPLQDGRDDQPVGLEGAGWAEGQDRVALLHGQVQATQEAVAKAVAAPEDDPAPPGPQDKESPELPPARPLRAALVASAARPGRHQPDQEPVAEGWQPEGEHRGGVHADRPGQQGLRGRWPGLGWVIPGAGQLEEDAEHVHQPHREVLVVGAEEDGGDLADQPHQPASGEQQGRHRQPEGVRHVLVVAVGIAVTPHLRRLLAGVGGHGSVGPRAGTGGNGAGHRGRSRCFRP
jgi:hypothetical protein